jgi:SAM-dependent methyltransferase
MKLPRDIGQLIQFTCNICGAGNSIQTAAFHREAAQCQDCGSVARFRGIVHAVSQALYGQSFPLSAMPLDKSIVGIGMSDSDIYASGLEKAFNYRNTYYHMEPKLDITRIDLEMYHDLDFIISTDVLEHVALPLEPAFRNLRMMLKRGGFLIISVPYSSADKTTEHFPNIYEHKLVEIRDGEWVLVNRSRSKQWEVHENLVFHGGPGTTVEMRVFSERDLIQLILLSGFMIEKIYSEPLIDIGYYWPLLRERDHDIGAPLLAYVITARAI